MPKTDDRPLQPRDEPYITINIEITEAGALFLVVMVLMLVGVGLCFVRLLT